MATWKEIAEDSLQDEFLKKFEGAGEHANLLNLHLEIYRETGDPAHLLAAFCYHVSIVDDDKKRDGNDLVPAPLWILRALAGGFSAYLNGVAQGEDASLEESLGITKAKKVEAMRLITLEEMAEQVHLLRWLFGLKDRDACRATFSKYESQVAALGLEPKGQGITRDLDSFIDFYYRKYAKGYKKWAEQMAAQGAMATERTRERILSQMPQQTARFVKRRIEIS